MATFRYALPDDAALAHRARLTAQIVPAVAAEAGIAGCHLLVADEAASAVETAEKKVRAQKNLVPRWIVLVESWGDEMPFIDWCARFALSAFGDASVAPLWAIYRLQNSRDRLRDASR